MRTTSLSLGVTLVIGLLLMPLLASCASHARQDDGMGAAPAAASLFAPNPHAEPATQPAFADESAAPQQPQLPAGHPDISAMMGGGGSGAAPATQPAGAAMPGLPKGHPDISSMMGGAAGPGLVTATTSLNIKAVQSTLGGPAIGAGATATVEVYDRDRVVAELDAKLNEKGEVTVSGIPVGPTFQPLVTVNYNDVSFQAIGQPIASATPQTVAVKVYESTDEPVGWEVRMRHIMLQPTAEGVQVMDMLAIDNATDRAYVGQAGPDGSRTTFALPIAAGARDVKFVEGFHDCCTKVENGAVVNTMAITPGTTQYQLTYFVPHSAGKSEVLAVAPATTKHFIVVAPDDGTTITGEGLESGTTNMGNGVTRFFKANNVPADRALKLTVSGTPTRAPAPVPAAAAPAARAVAATGGMDSAQIAKTVAGLGGLLIFLIGGAMFFRRPGNNMSKKQPENRS